MKQHNKVRNQGASERVAEHLRSDILSGRYPIGSRIAGEHELMRQFTSSRQTIREALRELAAGGLIQSRRGHTGGAFVSAPDLEKVSTMMRSAGAMMGTCKTFRLSEVLLAMFWIETACCRMAAERRTEADIDTMQAAILEAGAIAFDDPIVFFEKHTAFNRALWAAAGNEPLKLLLEDFFDALRSTSTRQTISEHGATLQSFLRANHQAILNAIVARDGDLAERHMRANVDFWAKAMGDGINDG